MCKNSNLALRYLISKKVITLKELNGRLKNFDYGYMDIKAKPSLIAADTMTSGDFKLKQSGKLNSNFQFSNCQSNNIQGN